MVDRDVVMEDNQANKQEPTAKAKKMLSAIDEEYGKHA